MAVAVGVSSTIMAIISLLLAFLPTVIAVLKGNGNKLQILFLNVLPYLISLITLLFPTAILQVIVSVISVIVWILSFVRAIRGY